MSGRPIKRTLRAAKPGADKTANGKIRIAGTANSGPEALWGRETITGLPVAPPRSRCMRQQGSPCWPWARSHLTPPSATNFPSTCQASRCLRWTHDYKRHGTANLRQRRSKPLVMP